jgi:hypothetical protein
MQQVSVIIRKSIAKAALVKKNDQFSSLLLEAKKNSSNRASMKK